MDVAHGGMPAPRTCTLPFLNLTLIVVAFCHCWNNVDASSLLYEPPYTEPYVRWCGRTAEVTPPPTRFVTSSAVWRSVLSAENQVNFATGTLWAHKTIKGGRVAAFIIALKCCTNLHYVEPAAGVEPATF